MLPSTMAAYEFLKTDLADSLDARFKRQAEEVVQMVRSLVGNLSSRLNDLKLSIGMDLDELRTGMDRAAPVISPSHGEAPATSPSSSGSS